MNHGNKPCRYLAKEPIASALNGSPSSAFYSFPVFSLLEPDQRKPDLERRQSYKCALGKAKGLAAAAGAGLDTWVTPHRESAVAAMISQACRQLHQRTTQPGEKRHPENSPAASRPAEVQYGLNGGVVSRDHRWHCYSGSEQNLALQGHGAEQGWSTEAETLL